ncbi:uncharacterized protein C20orf96 homolog isoform X7 [Microtus ochrogaster]|uniref:Uncharacterized protein C20orf96 homolog isoform X7 n=1 Tax=Microtus ochrogaster TaxID=79684 RepID=A0ABM1UM10_MICOH|nr:uncharacterized protein C20orf96 homolog isoform X7 [Microtus ochrogaster]
MMELPPSLPRLFPDTSTLGLTPQGTSCKYCAVPELWRDGKPSKESARAAEKGASAPWEDAGQAPADAVDASKSADLTPGALQPRELPQQAQPGADQVHPGHGGQHGPERAHNAAAAGHSRGLQREVEQLHAEILKAHEEVSFLSTYMDHEYPVRSVQIANHIRQVQQAKDSQQDELDNLKEMRDMVLGGFSDMIQEKKKKILRSLVVKTQQPYEEVLTLKTQDSRRLQRCTVWFRELIEQMKKEIPILTAEVGKMYAEIWNPRDVVFKDILLQRPKCTPDMAVELNIPVQEPLPF